MLTILYILVFIFSMALASLGIFLSLRLRNNYRSETFNFLLYFQVFIFTFGFYGIWGQVLIKTFLTPYLSDGLQTRFSNISLLMGLPFLVFAWLMLLLFSSSIAGRQKVRYFVPGFLIMNFSLLFLLGYFIAQHESAGPESLIRNYFIIMNLSYALLASYIIRLSGRSRILTRKQDMRIPALLLSLITAIQCVPLVFYTTESWIGLIFIFVFFSGNVFLPVFLSYAALLPAVPDKSEQNLSFGDFCSRYEISPRESDVIREICRGLSNREISESLFISLQTVKDHTHRIYIKTNVRNRVQLINLVKEVNPTPAGSAPETGNGKRVSPGVKNT